jgi:cholesterol transport system auxiliary component
MRYLLIGWLALVSTACSVIDKQPALHDFGQSVVSSAQQGKMSITVNAPTWLWDNRIRYRLLFVSPSQIRFYGLDRWIASPPELFEQLLIFSGKALDYTLLIRLQDFEQQFDAADRARVVLRFSVQAYSIKDKQEVGRQEFLLQQATKTPDAAGAVSGFTDLAQQAAKRIQDWLAGLPERKV